MTVETVTDRPMTEELLKTFAGSVKFTGQLSQTNEDPEGSGVQEDDPVLTDISVVYDKAAQAVWFTYSTARRYWTVW